MAAPRTDAEPTDAAERHARRSWFVEVYRTSVGKKYAMALSGLVLMAYVLLHMLGNLKLYYGRESMNSYAEFLRLFGSPAAPESSVLWIVRLVLLAAFVVHIHAAWALWRTNRRARPEGYEAKRHWIAADFASRTMRWSGVIVGLFVAFHLADMTFLVANPEPDHADVYQNVVSSFQRVPVSALYILGNLALGLHLYHGAWSLFQSMGWNRPGFNHWRRYAAVAFAVAVTLGNISFPVAVLTGLTA